MADTTSTKETDALRHDLNALRDDVSHLTETLKGMASSRGSEAYDRLRQTADQTRTRVRDTASAAVHQVEERPLTSVLIAFGVGMLLGILFDRRS